MKINTRTRAEIYLLIITVFWGSTFVLTKLILINASPFVYISIRFITALILFTAIFLRKIRTIPKETVIKGALLGFLIFLGFGLQTIGLKYTTASKSAFITGLFVVFVPLFQFLIERKKPKIGNLVGVCLVAIGLYLMTSPKGSEFNFGDVLTLLCAIVFSIYVVYLDVLGDKHDPVHLTFMQFSITALCGLISIPLFETAYININISFLLILLYLAVMPTIVAIYVMVKYQKNTTPTRSAVIYSLEPPIAAIFAFFIIGEIIGVNGVFGGLLILFGLIVSELSDILFKFKQKKEFTAK